MGRKKVRVATHGQLSGRIQWELLDKNGRIVQSGKCSNLILNRGLDTFASMAHDTTNSATPYFGIWRQYACVGSGSTAPAVGQTTLVNEVMRTGSTGGFSETVNTYSLDAPNNKIVGSFTIVRALTFTAAFNLTEYGFSESSSSVVNIRELFRDAGGNPITLSVQSGQQLKITHTLTISLPFGDNLAASFDITGLGTMTGKATYFYNGPVNWYFIFTHAFNPGQTNLSLRLMDTANTGSATTPGGTYNGTHSYSPTLSNYVTGTYSRTRTYVIPTSEGNYAQYGWILDVNSSGTSPAVGFKFSLTNPASVVKSSNNKLTLVHEVTWGRAA